MRTSQKFQMLLTISALGCSQGPSWSAPALDGGLDAFDAGSNEVLYLDSRELQVELLMPSNGQRCAHVGDFVPLQALLIAANSPTVSWYFQRDKQGCGPVPLGTQGESSLDANGYATLMWSTACALDIPDECGVGSGQIVVEVADRTGEPMAKSVSFCLELPLGSDMGAVQAAAGS